MTDKTSTIQAIQGLLGVTQDGIFGPKSKLALEALVAPEGTGKHAVIASSFADPADVAAFVRCKALGKSDQECFKYGDNAVGAWGDSTAAGSGPSCALPPEHIIEKWGSLSAGRNKKVLVTHGERETVCTLKDTMPHLANIKNGAGIDLNFDACKTIGLTPPIMAPCTWEWV